MKLISVLMNKQTYCIMSENQAEVMYEEALHPLQLTITSYILCWKSGCVLLFFQRSWLDNVAGIS